MKILILSNEVWNDKINGNNVLSNWFEGIDAEFANIYASGGVPFNKCCKKYFQITDVMILKSIITGKKAGIKLTDDDFSTELCDCDAEIEPKRLYSILKKISGSFMRLIRELMWMIGKYNLVELKKFIDEFQPDVIFSERMASCKMLRLEKIIYNITDTPFFAFTGDDEYSLNQFNLSPFFWINRFMIRKRLKENVSRYRIYYMLSEEQKKFYESEFNCRCKLLQKCGEFDNRRYVDKQIHKPIRMIYAGKFYCNRWKMLIKITRIIREINKDEVKIVLDIYTKDIPNKIQNKYLNDGRNSFIRGAVSQEELKIKYEESDIALHVESDDLRNRLLTKYSFSTKIIDCIFSGCAVMAYCWNQHSGLTYLKKENAGICISSQNDLKSILNRFVNNPALISEYSKKAYACGINKHSRKEIQNMLLLDFGKG